MGEAPALFVEDVPGDVSNVIDLKSRSQQTTIVVGQKTYVIGGIVEELSSAIPVLTLDKSTAKWEVPFVLGAKPQPCKGYSALVIDDNRILVAKGNSHVDDSFWFLEVGTPFVREQTKNLKTEVVAWSKGVVGGVKKPVVITGPSGVGKGTLISKLMKEFPSKFGFSVSHTTRAPRENEKDGIHYHFTERSVMEKDIEAGKFLEFASVHGNLYGTSIETVEVVADAGKRCILDIDVQGARSVRTSPLEAIFVFIRPPSFEKLEQRLRTRGTETEEQIQKRLRNAKAELEKGNEPGLFDHILINDDLETCYQSLKKLLSLNESVEETQDSLPKWFNIPEYHSISRIGQKIFINIGQSEVDKTPHNMYELDLSSLKGGAPGRTRGLNLHQIDSSANGITG